jgi:hypothetical protein
MADFFTSPGLTQNPSGANVQGISSYLAPYVSNMLGNTQALANAPMPTYTGQLTAGASPLQQQAFSGLANLTLPSQMTQAGGNLQGVQQAEQNIQYNPTTATNQYTPTDPYNPINATNQYSSLSPYSSINATNQYSAPSSYNAATFQNTYNAPTTYQGNAVGTGTFDTGAANAYMNPYIQAALQPQLNILNQQYGMKGAQEQAAATSSGAFGGTREALANSLNQQNQNLAANQLVSSGYNTAYNNAMQQFNADQARQLQAQQANVQQAEFGSQQGMTNAQLMAQYGMTAQQADEASRQFAAQQAQTSAQNAAQYGNLAQQSNIQQGEFGYQQALANAQNLAQYGNLAQQSNIQQNEFGNQQALANAQNLAQYGNLAQQANIQQGEFGANLGLQGLQAATQANQAMGNVGTNMAQYNLSNINALGAAGSTQQAQNQSALNAQYNQYLQQLQYPQTMAKLQSGILQGLPDTTSYTYGAQPSGFQNLAGTLGGLGSLYQNVSQLPGISGLFGNYTNPTQATLDQVNQSSDPIGSLIQAQQSPFGII